MAINGFGRSTICIKLAVVLDHQLGQDESSMRLCSRKSSNRSRTSVHSSIPPVAVSQKSSGELASLGKQCLRWIKLYGDPASCLKPSSAFTIHVSFRYISIRWRHGQLLRPYQETFTGRITGALGASSTSSIGQSLLPMMRFVPVLDNRCCQTLSGVVVCRSLAISTEQIHSRTTTELCRPALRALLQIGDEG